ncbi:MAG: hypothetical protein WCR59_04300 [Planctomycetota bacterium]
MPERDDVVTAANPNALTVMIEWARTPQQISTARGAHRLVFDLRLQRAMKEQGQPGPGFVDDENSLPISAIWHDTPYMRQGEWLPPGRYTVRLKVDGVSTERALEVRMDKRRM